MMAHILASLLSTVAFATAPPEGCTRPGCAWPPNNVWIERGRFDQETEQYLVAHELGHVFDYQRMDNAARNRFRSIMKDPRPWRSPPNSPHEQFAEAVTSCRPPVWYDVGYGYDYHPTEHQWRSVCRLILHVEQTYEWRLAFRQKGLLP